MGIPRFFAIPWGYLMGISCTFMVSHWLSSWDSHRWRKPADFPWVGLNIERDATAEADGVRHGHCTELEAGHSIEYITEAEHSIESGAVVVARRDGHAAPSRHATTQPQRDGAAWLPRRDVMHFVTL